MKILTLCLLAASASVSLAQVTYTDELAKTVTACGKPSRDYQVDPRTLIKGVRTRSLTYGDYELHFTSRKSEARGAWVFSSADHGGAALFGHAELVSAMPCLSALFPEVLPARAKADENSAKSDEVRVMAFTFLVVGAFLYFLPCFVAWNRKVAARGGIQALNIFLGWTLVGWIIALCWAATAETEQQVRAKTIDYDKLAAAMAARDRSSGA